MAKHETTYVREGMSTYRDNRKHQIYYDALTKKGFYIFPGDQTRFSILQARLPLALIIGYALSHYFFKDKVSYFAIISIVFIVVFELLFRFLFLSKLEIDEQFVKPNSIGFFKTVSNNISFQKIIFILVLMVAIFVLSIKNIKDSNFTGIILYLNYFIVIGIIVLFILTIVALIIKIKDSKK